MLAFLKRSDRRPAKDRCFLSVVLSAPCLFLRVENACLRQIGRRRRSDQPGHAIWLSYLSGFRRDHGRSICRRTPGPPFMSLFVQREGVCAKKGVDTGLRRHGGAASGETLCKGTSCPDHDWMGGCTPYRRSCARRHGRRSDVDQVPFAMSSSSFCASTFSLNSALFPTTFSSCFFASSLLPVSLRATA